MKIVFNFFLILSISFKFSNSYSQNIIKFNIGETYLRNPKADTTGLFKDWNFVGYGGFADSICIDFLKKIETIFYGNPVQIIKIKIKKVLKNNFKIQEENGCVLRIVYFGSDEKLNTFSIYKNSLHDNKNFTGYSNSKQQNYKFNLIKVE